MYELPSSQYPSHSRAAAAPAAPAVVVVHAGRDEGRKQQCATELEAQQFIYAARGALYIYDIIEYKK